MLCVAGYFASVVQAPMTDFVIILEMTGNHDYYALTRMFVAEAVQRRWSTIVDESVPH